MVRVAQYDNPVLLTTIVKTSVFKNVVSVHHTETRTIAFDTAGPETTALKTWWDSRKTVTNALHQVESTLKTALFIDPNGPVGFWNGVHITATVNQGSMTYKGCSKACSSENVSPEGDGQWYCSSCLTLYADFTCVLMIRMIVRVQHKRTGV